MDLYYCIPVSDICYGARGQEVKLAQKLLYASGYPLTIDGIYGPKTKEALYSFLKRAGVMGTGGEIKKSQWEALLNYEVTKNEK